MERDQMPFKGAQRLQCSGRQGEVDQIREGCVFDVQLTPDSFGNLLHRRRRRHGHPQRDSDCDAKVTRQLTERAMSDIHTPTVCVQQT